MSQWLKRVTQFFTIICLSIITIAQAQVPDPVNGKTLYNTTVAGLSCGMGACHGADPSLNQNKVRNGANNPTIIQNAINAGIAGMNVFLGTFSAAQLADIAAYIANPGTTSSSPAIALSANSLSFPNTLVNTSSTPMILTITNTGTANLVLNSVALGGTPSPNSYAFVNSCPTTLAPNVSCSISVTFSPTLSGAVIGDYLNITHNATGLLSTITLVGTGVASTQPTISLSASTVDFGTFPIGSNNSRLVSILNTGSQPVHFSAISISSATPGVFTLVTDCFPASTLQAGASCSITLGTMSAAPGLYSGTLSIVSDALSSPHAINLMANIVPALGVSGKVTPTNLIFSSTPVGTSSSQQVILQNTSPSTLITGLIQVTGAASNAFATSGCSNIFITPIPNTCIITVTYTPQGAGTDTAMLVIPTNASNVPQFTVALSGTAVAPPPPLYPLIVNLSPATQDFGTAKVNTMGSTKTFTLTNTGKPNFIYSIANITGSNNLDFTVLSTGSCVNGMSLVSQASCTVDVNFVPTATSARSATLTLLTTQTNPMGLPAFVPPSSTLTGTGVTESNGLIEFTQDGLAVSSVKVAADGKVTKLTLKNNGAATFKVTNITFLVNSTNYKIIDECSGKTLKRGQTCEIKLQYIGPALAAGAMPPTAELITISTDNGAQKAIPISLTPADISATSGSATPKTGGCMIGDGDDLDLSHLAMLAIAMGALIARRQRARKIG
jgi:Abnormal spindle-like microcephaly-assoc'd, ASPM-SPD-2-Hydin